MLALQIYGLLVLGSFLIVGYVLLRPIVAAWLCKHFGDPDPYPPEAAEAPMACGCPTVGGEYSCLHCGKVRCERHHKDPHACVDPVEHAYATVGDTFGFGASPSIVAGSDLDGNGLLFEAYELIKAYRRGEAIEADAPKERL